MERIFLRSRRGTRIHSGGTCAQCGIFERPVFRYSESNRGEVLICLRCKPEIFDRSFGQLDVVDMGRPAGSPGLGKKR